MRKNRTKCLFVLPSLLRAGAETQTIDLVNGIDALKYEKHLLVFEKNIDQFDRIDKDTVIFHHVVRRTKFSFMFIKKISMLIDRYDVDIIHCTLQISLLFSLLACVFSKNKPRIVVAIHTTTNVNLKNELIDKYLYRYLFKYCKKIIFVCYSQKKHWLKKYPEIRSKNEVVYNGVDVDFFSPGEFINNGLSLKKKLNIPCTSPVIVCIAGFRKEKAHNILLNTLSNLPDNIHLILAGDGELRCEIQKMVNTLNLTTRVHLVGNVNDVRPILAASDISVLTSTSVETFSIAMLESMSMKVPFIATNIGGLSEAIVKGVTGDLFSSGDINELKNILLYYLSDKDRLKNMGMESRKMVKDRFSKNIMINKTEDILNNILN